ncbi:MAG: ABC-F family ATP-binding cassette domain-containing protein, partial [Deltaproteobacteria bacterium]|nr:ABC-F family ATP-binding cassette domain-containing protein [Deltaproteobacteria bacterium]
VNKARNAMIRLKDLKKQYGSRILFAKLTLSIGDSDRIAVVGRNGAGKTTFLKIITGAEEPDSGQVISSRYSTTGYLPQEGVYHHGKTILEEVASVFADVAALHYRIEQLSHELAQEDERGADSTDRHELLQELGRTQQALEDCEGYAVENKVSRVLFGLGFNERDLQRMTEEFSGGWQMRIELAKLLLKKPSVLLLDEPTNHLDLESLAWLEEYLSTYEGALIVISHDARFLDNLTNRVLELSQGHATEYRGNYSSYLSEKATREILKTATLKNQRRIIEGAERFINRFKAKASKARQVQSRIKQLERIELSEEGSNERTITFRFPEPPHSGRVIIELQNVAKSYEGLSVFGNLSLLLERGDRVALVGVNGSGKSTLARIIAGRESFNSGKRILGHNVTIGYYAQDTAEMLNPAKTVLETVSEVSEGPSPTELRTLLGCFLFTGDDVFKTVAVLSGGEKSRLALARLLLAPANLLVLDEPTNHLDAVSKEILQQRLLTYGGSLLIVSHDRDFLSPLITRVGHIVQGRLIIHHSTVDDYLGLIDKENKDSSAVVLEKLTVEQPERQRKRREAELRQERHKLLRPVIERIAALEIEIERSESRRRNIEELLGDERSYSDGSLVRNLSLEHAGLLGSLESLYAEWEQFEQEAETIRQRFSSTILD